MSGHTAKIIGEGQTTSVEHVQQLRQVSPRAGLTQRRRSARLTLDLDTTVLLMVMPRGR
jgi:hypothetical protein